LITQHTQARIPVIRGSTITIKAPRGFDLSRAVCSYGYFLLAPNLWDAEAKVLHRPLRGDEHRLIHTMISQHKNILRVACDQRVSRREANALRQQVTRTLRLNEDFKRWYQLYPAAKRARFGRLFRSPTVFEDIVKTMTGCNVTWPNTMRMNQLLCEHVGAGGFPTAKQLAGIRIDTLKRRCKVGYRAKRIIQLARQVVRGQIDLDWFEQPARSTDEVFKALLQIYGIGDYAAANICQLLGRYEHVAIDTETYRHFRQQHNVDGRDDLKLMHQHINDYFDQYAPYQFLAYWFDLWQGYQQRFGDARTWSAKEHGPNFTAANMK